MNISLVSNPVKVVLFTGTFQLTASTNQLGYSVICNVKNQISLDYLDIRVGLWNVCLKDIFFENAKTADTQDLICTVSTNLVDGLFYNENQVAQHFNPPLIRFRLSSKLQSFSRPNWLTINVPTPNIDLHINLFPKLKKGAEFQALNCPVTATLLFQSQQ